MRRETKKRTKMEPMKFEEAKYLEPYNHYELHKDEALNRPVE